MLAPLLVACHVTCDRRGRNRALNSTLNRNERQQTAP